MISCTVNGRKHEITGNLAESTLLEWLRGMLNLWFADCNECLHHWLPAYPTRQPPQLTRRVADFTWSKEKYLR